MKVPHGESPQLRKLAARAHVDQALENHAGPRYHGCVAAATGPNSNRYEPVRLFILLPGRSDSVAKHRGALQLIRARGIVVVTSLQQPHHAARLGRVGLGQRGDGISRRTKGSTRRGRNSTTSTAHKAERLESVPLSSRAAP